MDKHECDLVNKAFSRYSQELRSAQRSIEVMANMFEYIRKLLPWEESYRVWHFLNTVPNLERLPYYHSRCEAKSEEWTPQENEKYRWCFFESALPFYHAEQELKGIKELHEILSKESA